MSYNDYRINNDDWLRYWLIDELIKLKPNEEPTIIIAECDEYFNYIRQTKNYAPIKEIK